MIYDLQKASIMKRFSAFLLDLVIFVMLFIGILFLGSTIVNYDQYMDDYLAISQSVKEEHNIKAIEDEYGILFNDYGQMTTEEIELIPQEVRIAYDKCYEVLETHTELSRLMAIMVYLALAIFSISMLLTHLILEFFVPLLFKNGQTIGKKIFSIAVMRVDGVRITPFLLFVRTIFGKYTIETMLPAIMLLLFLAGFDLIVCFAVVLLIFLIQVVLLITSKTRSPIHDYLSSTVVVDMQSQMIFDNEDAKREYQLRLHKEAVEKAPY